MNSSQFRLHLQQLLILLIACTNYDVSKAYTYEPPGRDPVSIDQVRNSEKAVRLTADNFDELTKDKLVFIKFYAPYCPHCKSIAGAWSQLATYYEESPDNDNILVGSIDCTDSPKGKALCARFKIMGLPTLLYGSAYKGGAYLEEYGDGKTFEELKSFAIEALVPTCNPGSLDACPTIDRQHMENAMAMPYDALVSLIEGLEKMEEDAKIAYKEKFAKLQKLYDELLMYKELQIVKSKANVKLIKEVMAMKA